MSHYPILIAICKIYGQVYYQLIWITTNFLPLSPRRQRGETVRTNLFFQIQKLYNKNLLKQ
ncbi:MAG: hypothetical protein LBR79_04060 [Oscillospiraceae bacterium]|nr:hypothetical protein [Oscillospiraceae bacterium]